MLGHQHGQYLYEEPDFHQSDYDDEPNIEEVLNTRDLIIIRHFNFHQEPYPNTFYRFD